MNDWPDKQTRILSKMKYYSLIAFLFIHFQGVSQNGVPVMPVDNSTNKISYTEVVTVDSASPADLYSRAREWFAKTYKSSKNVLQMDDKDAGKLVGNALLQVYYKALGAQHDGGNINYTISIYLKDGRYKYEITDMYHTGPITSAGKQKDYGPLELFVNDQRTYPFMSKKAVQKISNSYLAQVDEYMNSLISSLKADMRKASGAGNKNDW